MDALMAQIRELWDRLVVRTFTSSEYVVILCFLEFVRAVSTNHIVGICVSLTGLVFNALPLFGYEWATPEYNMMVNFAVIFLFCAQIANVIFDRKYQDFPKPPKLMNATTSIRMSPDRPHAIGTLESEWVVNGPATRVGKYVQAWAKREGAHVEYASFEKESGFVHLAYFSSTVGLAEDVCLRWTQKSPSTTLVEYQSEPRVFSIDWTTFKTRFLDFKTYLQRAVRADD